MKRLILCVSFLFAISLSETCVYAKDHTKEYIKLITKLDVDSTAIHATSAEEFWNCVVRNNVALNTFMDALEQEKSSAMKANMEVNKSIHLSKPYFANLDVVADNSDSLLMSMMGDAELRKIYSDIKLHIVREEDANAGCTPDGRIYFNTGLFWKDIEYSHMMGYLAHEFAHFLLQHSKVRCYKAMKKSKTNKIIVGVSTAIQAGATIFSAANGVETDMESFNENVTKMFEEAELQAHRYRFKYNREQELEADIVAYRFLECMGYGGEKYVEALEHLQSPYEYVDDYSTHPLISFRIGLLKYMAAHPEIGKSRAK